MNQPLYDANSRARQVREILIKEKAWNQKVVINFREVRFDWLCQALHISFVLSKLKLEQPAGPGRPSTNEPSVKVMRGGLTGSTVYSDWI